MKNKNFSGYTVAIGLAIVIMCTQGALTTFGVFLPYIISSEGWSVAAVSFMATCCNTVTFIMNTLMFKSINKIGAKKTLLIGIFCCGLHYFIYGSSTSIFMLYLGACVGGVAMGFATNAMLSFILTRWFVEKRNRIISLAMIPIGFGGTIFSFISGQAISLFNSWRTAYFVVGALVWILAIPIALIMVKESPASLGQLPLGATAQVEDLAPKAKVRLKDMPEVKTTSFWLMWSGLFLCGFVGPGLAQHFTSILRAGGVEAVSASNYLSLAKFFTAVGFLLLGMLSGKKTKTKVIVTLIVSALVLSCISLFVIDGAPATGLVALVWFSIVFYGIGQTAQHIISTYTVMDAYGPQRYSTVYGVFQGAAMFAGAFGSLVLGAFKDLLGDYRLGLIIYAVIAVVGMILVYAAMDMQKKRSVSASNE